MTTAPTRLILNPAAGRGAGRRMIAQLEDAAAAAGMAIDLVCTSGPGDARERAKAAVGEGLPLLIVAGGDGTISEAAGVLVGSQTMLAIVPVGTGNDLVRHLGLPLDPIAAFTALSSAVPFSMDVGMANGIPFLVATGAGFDAAVAEEINRGYRFVRGSAAYALALLRTLWGYAPTAMRVEVDDHVEEFRGYFTVAANARGYGGGMQIAPGASVTDGMLDVCCVRALPRYQFVVAAAKVYKGGHVTHPGVTMLRGRSVTIISDPPVPITIDGELQGLTPVKMTVIPGALRLALPAGLKTPT